MWNVRRRRGCPWMMAAYLFVAIDRQGLSSITVNSKLWEKSEPFLLLKKRQKPHSDCDGTMVKWIDIIPSVRLLWVFCLGWCLGWKDLLHQVFELSDGRWKAYVSSFLVIRWVESGDSDIKKLRVARSIKTSKSSQHNPSRLPEKHILASIERCSFFYWANSWFFRWRLLPKADHHPIRISAL